MRMHVPMRMPFACLYTHVRALSRTRAHVHTRVYAHVYTSTNGSAYTNTFSRKCPCTCLVPTHVPSAVGSMPVSGFKSNKPVQNWIIHIVDYSRFGCLAYIRPSQRFFGVHLARYVYRIADRTDDGVHVCCADHAHARLCSRRNHSARRDPPCCPSSPPQCYAQRCYRLGIWDIEIKRLIGLSANSLGSSSDWVRYRTGSWPEWLVTGLARCRTGLVI